MRRMSYRANFYYQTANIYFIYGPWWSFWLEDIVSWLCELVPAIPFPKLPFRLWDSEAIESNGGKRWTTLKDWWGNLQELYEAKVCMQISAFCFRHQAEQNLEVNYEVLKRCLSGRDIKSWKLREKEVT